MKAKEMKSYKFTVYAVQTFGGQICNDQQPRPVEIVCSTAEEMRQVRERVKRRMAWDNFYCYYISEKEARAAINWALSN